MFCYYIWTIIFDFLDFKSQINLTVTCHYFRDHLAITDLYHIDRKYTKEGQIEILKNIKKEDLRELIREVAFSIFQTGNEYITKVDLLKLPATQSFLTSSGF
jgi:hypothetical protein